MSTSLQLIANTTGVSEEEITKVLSGMIISAKSQHGAVATPAELAVVVGVCAKYQLNPLVRECAAFVSGGKLQVVVMVDGFAKIVNRQPDFDGFDMEDKFDDKGKIFSSTCTMYLKSRSHPVKVTEYLSECFMPSSSVWKKYPSRMLHHKAYIQAARMAFGLSEVVDNDEVDRIKETNGTLNAPTAEIDYTEIESDFAECADDETLRKSASAWREKLQSTGNWESAKAKVAEMRLNHKNRIEAMTYDEIVVEADEFTEETE